MDILKILGVTLTAVCASLAVRQHRSDYALYIQIGASAIILSALLTHAGQLFGSLGDSLRNLEEAGKYFTLLMKAVVAVVTTQLVSQFCRDSGNGTLGLCVETAGRLAVLYISLPLLEAIIKTVTGIYEG